MKIKGKKWGKETKLVDWLSPKGGEKARKKRRLIDPSAIEIDWVCLFQISTNAGAPPSNWWNLTENYSAYQKCEKWTLLEKVSGTISSGEMFDWNIYWMIFARFKWAMWDYEKIFFSQVHVPLLLLQRHHRFQKFIIIKIRPENDQRLSISNQNSSPQFWIDYSN